MQAPTFLYVLETPLADGGGILAEHAFAGAGDVAEDEVELCFGLAEVTGVVVSDDAVGPAPFGDVLQKDLGTGRDGLVAHEDAAIGQDCAHGGGLAAGGGAEVEGGYCVTEGRFFCDIARDVTKEPSLCYTSEDVGDEHGGGFLNVVAAGMEEGIEGELGTAGEVEALGTPGDFFKLRIEN